MELTQAQWDLVAAAEAPLYTGSNHAHAYTSVIEREGDDHLASMWEDAWVNVSGVATGSDDEIEKEVAKRVALAQAVLAFGLDFVAQVAG